MLNTNVTNVLQALSSIPQNDKACPVVLRYPETVINSAAGDILVYLNIAKLDPEEFKDIGINNIPELLNAFKLFSEDRVATLTDNVISITEGNAGVEYITNSIDLLSQHDKKVSIFETTESVPTVAKFQISVDQLKQIRQASGVFKDLNEVIFTSQDGDMTVKLGNQGIFNSRSNAYEVSIPAETTKEFTVKIPVENFNKLPVSNYRVEVKYNNTKNAYRVLFLSDDIPDMKIIMAVKVK